MQKSQLRGLTLIELIVVVAILGLLLAILMPVTYRGPIRAGPTKATRTLVNGISAGLVRYYQEFNQYPPSTRPGLSGAVDPASLYKYLCGPAGNGFSVTTNFDGKSRTHRFAPYISIPPEYVNAGIVVDTWGRPLVYYNCKAHVDAGGAAYCCYNPQSFDMFSTGPDGVRDPNNKIGQGIPISPNPKLVDDIANISGQ